jgi:hypothetical protein
MFLSEKPIIPARKTVKKTVNSVTNRIIAVALLPDNTKYGAQKNLSK